MARLQNLIDAWERAIVSTPISDEDSSLFEVIHNIQGGEDGSSSRGKTIMDGIRKLFAVSRDRNRSINDIVCDHLLSRSQKAATQPEDEDGADANAVVGDKWGNDNTYILVEKVLDGFVRGTTNLEESDQSIKRPDKKALVLQYALEMWFLAQTDLCTTQAVLDDKKEVVVQLLKKYTEAREELDQDSRLDVLKEKDCTDLVECLLRYGKFPSDADEQASFGKALKNHLEDKQNFKTFNKTPMSKTMIDKFQEFSSRYIIPAGGLKTRGYGFFVSGAPYSNDRTNHEGDKLDLKYIRSSFKSTGLWSPQAENLYTDLPPEEEELQAKNHNTDLPPTRRWDIDQFNKKVTSLLIEIEEEEPICSVLIFILACHGFNQHICGADEGSYQEVIELLHKISRDKLQGVPKVVIIQACQNADDLPNPEDSSIMKSLEADSTLDDIFLVMTAKPGEYYFANADINFTRYFSRYLKESDGTKSMAYIINKAAVKESCKRKIPADEPQISTRPTVKDIRLPGVTGQSQLGEEDTDDEPTDEEGNEESVMYSVPAVDNQQ